MSTTIRSETSKKNPYWIDRHRYYELKHFCLQYPIWKKIYEMTSSYSSRPPELIIFSSDISDPVERCASAREFYGDRIKMLEDCADATDPVIGRYILAGVTEGMSYEFLRSRYDVPCCKDVYYGLYRKFFWILSTVRR